MYECQSCGCTDTRQANMYYDERGLVEYGVYCNECNHRIGTWAYGYWEENDEGDSN